MVKLATNTWELRFQDGSKSIYGIPEGTTSLQPFLVEQRDRFGYSLRFGYNSDVRLTTVTDAQSRVTRLEYDAQGHITRVFDPFGRHTRFSYDASGNMVEAVDMEGNAFQYTYDSLIRITQINTAQGPWKFHHEGPDGNGAGDVYPAPGEGMWASIRLTVTDPANQKEEYFYYAGWGYDTDGIEDERSWHVSHNHYVEYTPEHNNASGDVRKTQWDTGTGASNQGELIGGKGKIRVISNAAGEKTYLDYDTNNGLPIAVTDARGKTTRTTYNGQGLPLTVTDPKGNVSTLTYAANGLDVTSITNANSVTVATYTYNSMHQVTSATDRSGTTQFTYTAWGALSTVTDPQDHVTTYSYNSLERLSSVSRDGVALGGFTYDIVGRVASATDSTGLTVSYEYNNLDVPTRVSYPDGTSEETDYTCCGLPGVVKDRSGRKSYYDYDALKRLVRVQDAAGNTLQMGYDADGNTTRLIDAKGQVTRWFYDAVGRAVEKQYHDGLTEGSTYVQGLLT